MNSHLIYNANIVTPREVVENGSVLVDDGIIAAVEGGRPRKIPKWCNPVDGQGRWLIPGIIDLHNDSIEKEVEPRPHALIPLEIALFSLESRLLGHGITSIFHSLSFMEGDTGARSFAMVTANIDKLNSFKKHGLIRHFIHARYDVTHKMFCAPLIDMIEADKVHLISFMDHTPGQGQYKDIEVYRRAYKKFAGMDDEAFMGIVAAKQRRAQAVNVIGFIDMIADRARRHNLPMASHDDDSGERIAFMKQRGVTISEFPVSLAVARQAAREGMSVVVGAPNIIRGVSNSGNMKAIDAVNNHTAHIICSDYLPSAILHAVFRLYRRHGLGLAEAVNMATLNPAKAIFKDKELGSIEPGKAADLVLVREMAGIPFVDRVFVKGLCVLSSERSLCGRINGEGYDRREREC